MNREKEIYDLLCAALNERGWNFECNEEKHVVHYHVDGDDFPMDFYIVVEEEQVRLFSPLNIKFTEEKRMEGAVATCFATSKLVDGCFDYNLNDGAVYFRLNHSLRGGTVPGKGFFYYIVDYSSFAVDKYNDTLLMLNKGLITLSDFIAKK